MELIRHRLSVTRNTILMAAPATRRQTNRWKYLLNDTDIQEKKGMKKVGWNITVRGIMCRGWGGGGVVIRLELQTV